jgi:uncharacterized protein (DUF697 family)
MNTAEQAVGREREYRMKAWYRAFLLIMGAPAVSGGIVMCALALKSASIAFPLLVTALFLGFGIYLIALGSRSRIILDGSRIEIRGAFTDRSADASEIEGYRTISSRNGKYTQIYLINGRRPMSFSNLFERDSRFDAWFRKVPNLDKRDRDALLEKISHEEELGATPQDRLDALSRAKTNSILAIVVAVAAAIAANWGIPALYVPFSFVLVLVPIALAIMLHRGPLLYAVFKRKADPRAELLYALMVASFGLLLRARGIKFVSLEFVGMAVAIIAVAYLAAFYHSLFESTSPVRTFFALLLFATLYGYGAMAVADAVGDGSPAARFSPRVIHKHYTTGRSRSYYLVLEPWGPLTRANSLGVSQKLYDKAHPGDSVCLELRQGRLSAPWYTQVPCYGADQTLQR